jgi:hypothetical protein
LLDHGELLYKRRVLEEQSRARQGERAQEGDDNSPEDAYRKSHRAHDGCQVPARRALTAAGRSRRSRAPQQPASQS